MITNVRLKKIFGHSRAGHERSCYKRTKEDVDGIYYILLAPANLDVDLHCWTDNENWCKPMSASG